MCIKNKGIKKTRNNPPERVPKTNVRNNKNGLKNLPDCFHRKKSTTDRITKKVTLNSELTFLERPAIPG